MHVAHLHCSLSSRSNLSACCTSTLFSQLIVIIIGEIGRVVSEEKRTQTATRQTSKFPTSKYFATLTCSYGGIKVKMKCTLYIYTVPSVDWYHHWRNRSRSFGGEANTNYYPSAKIICDERTDERTDGHADHYMATLRGHNYALFNLWTGLL